MTAYHSHSRPAGAAATDAEESAHRLAAVLRSRGMRMTPQRELVLAAVHRLGHATPEELGEAVDGVDAATVYRTLELLEELGLIRHTHLGHGAASYRPAEDDHIHVVCHSCGAVVDAAPDLVEAFAQRLLTDNGFEVDRGHLTIFGRCAACRAARSDGGTNGTAPALVQSS